MNETFVPFARRIDLSVEPSFTLGALHVSPATLELGRGDDKETIEPRVMQVLVALHRHFGEPVTREDLSQLCWGGLIVGDDALNRSISRLRKALAPDPALAIDTIPKIGYRLRRAPDVAIPTEQAHLPSPAASSGSRRWLVPLMLLLLLGIAVAAFLWTREAGRWTAEAMRPLTRDPGVETFPALSADGMLAYAGGAGFGAPRDIYLRGLALGDTAPLRLTATHADESSPAWSPEGDRLAFVRSQEGEPCAIVVTSPPRGAERVVARCRNDQATQLTWVSSGELAYSDRGARSEPRRLFRLDVASGAARPITAPAAGMSGDVAPAASPDGRWIAFRRSAALGSDDIFLLDLRSGSERALTRSGWKALGFAWSGDSGTLFLTTNRRGDFGLWSLDVTRDEPPQRISLGILPLGRISSDREGRVAVEASRMRVNLAGVAASGDPEPITRTAGIDWDPDIAADGSIVYASDVSGTAEIWLKRPDAQPVRLTNLNGSYVHSPHWSRDGREIAFIAVRGQRTDIHAIDADGSRLRRITADGRAKGSIAWSGPGSELLYTVRDSSGWHVRRARGGLPPEREGEGAVVVRSAPNGTFFVRTLEDSALRIFDPETGSLASTPNPIRVPDLEAWAPGRGGVYWLRDGGTPRAALWFTSYSGNQRLVSLVGPAPRPNFTVRAADDMLITPRLLQDDSDLVLLELKRD